MNTLAAWLALALYLAFAVPPWRKALARVGQYLGDWSVGVLLLPYLLAVSLRPPLADLLRFAIYLALPTLLLRYRRRGAKPMDIWQILALLCLWVPVEADLFGLFVDLAVPAAGVRTALSRFYLLPEVSAALAPGVHLPVDKLTAALLGLWLFLVRYPLEGIGFDVRLRGHDLRDALLGLAAFAAVGIPTGLALGFLRFAPAVPRPLEAALSLVGGYLLVALPEEILFRGLIQNLLTRRLGKVALGLPLAAVVFGLGHLNNATRGFPVPNWAYVLMAAIAGLAYGWVWWRTGKVTASAATHALVNAIWGVAFR